jgi:hypothetical protein
MNLSALYDLIQSSEWQLTIFSLCRQRLVAKATWSEDDEAYADYIDQSCLQLEKEIQNAKATLEMF